MTTYLFNGREETRAGAVILKPVPMRPIPKKLRQDAIAEALMEIRFTCTDVPELVVGRLAANQSWKHLKPNRLPAAEIPAVIRQQEPNFRYQAILGLQSPDGKTLVKVGEEVISYHALRPYPGWERFGPELSSMIDFVFGSLTDFEAHRLGFRYVNTFEKQMHGISNITELDYNVSVSGSPLDPPLNLNYRRRHGDQHLAQVRLASPEFVSAPTAELSAVVDIDIYTLEGFASRSTEAARGWVEKAHDALKEEFFRLFTDDMYDRLVEEV